ncbi:MAG: hypothetical protein MZV64_62335 [Ignavibacteriales bacterium]|nr:hypothetical protein [Ignavibacteriales bacterium]
MAEGNVIIWGRLRGMVHAGIEGQSRSAVICALDFSPMQLRIADVASRGDEPADTTRRPQIAPHQRAWYFTG